jgi:hypothetical protein
MQRVLLAFLLVASATLSQPAASAAQAKVVWVDPSCQYFIAHLGEQFAIYNWRAGTAPNEGDVMEGDMTGQGLIELANTTQGGKNSVITMALSPTLRSLIHSSPVQCKRRFQSQ